MLQSAKVLDIENLFGSQFGVRSEAGWWWGLWVCWRRGSSSRMLLWLGDFTGVPHCPLSILKGLRRDTHVAKPGSALLTSNMWPVLSKLTLTCINPHVLYF